MGSRQTFDVNELLPLAEDGARGTIKRFWGMGNAAMAKKGLPFGEALANRPTTSFPGLTGPSIFFEKYRLRSPADARVKPRTTN
jgi:hypothetical protein